jgi:hypothetical protein
MEITIAAFFTLLVAWLLHLALWRVCLPNAQLKTLLIIFLLVWAAVVVALCLSEIAFFGVLGFLYFSLIYWSAAFCYVITYSAMEGDSPTLSLTRHLHRKGAAGISHEEVEEFFRQRPFVGARVKALVTDNIFMEESTGYRLASGRYLFFRLILGYRRVVFGPIKSGG